ncbi:MAG TPA: hypothetical protein VNO81_09490 [Candidatus Nitrosotenuis sp.]|jgi:hypothetical protein|nr:hypothetical protein [Candidatus Nitrosotenuis sp.]
MRRALVWLAAVLLAAAALDLPARAQLLMVTGDYLVVTVDKENERIGVCLTDANPDVVQNWVYVRAKTEIWKRTRIDAETYQEKKISYDQIWQVARKGQKMRVHGGRGWDGSITAKKIWM